MNIGHMTDNWIDGGQYCAQDVINLRDCVADLRSRLAEAQARAERTDGERNRAVSLLKELFAEVNGEAPRLLDDDCGGNGRLYLEIQELLSTPVPQGRTDGEREFVVERYVITAEGEMSVEQPDATAPEVKGGGE